MVSRFNQKPSYDSTPNVFLVGAPKSGTTSLHNYLKQHPQVWVSIPKEPYYFIENNSLFTSKEEYLDLWNDVNVPIRLEASPTYLYSGEACRNIHDFNPEAKILILLREPTALLHSLHQQLVNRHREPIRSFKEALDAEKDRLGTTSPPSRYKLSYSSYVHFSDHIEMYRERFGTNQVKTILLQDLAQNPQQTYQDILTFLNLPPHHPEFRTYNQRRTITYPALHEFLFGKNKGLKRLLQSIFSWHIQSKFKVLFGRLTTTRDTSDIPETLKNHLKRQLKPEVQRTADIIDRDLIDIWGYDSYKATNTGPLFKQPTTPKEIT